ncbi:hypothetical protein F5B19DRAFT_476964 [Rostrohypoxylon terebratum]|nr:hypothetical protein F5B19DRAFT_476964 [Rostrohypoxylon terebratum]
MLGDELRSVYQQYTADTNYVASWLAETAKANGCNKELLKPPVLSNSRPKGKARTSLKENQTHIIAIKNFIPLAKFIADFQPPISVPKSISAALRRVIKTRGNFSGLLREYGHDLNSLANDHHGHFVSVLASIYTILRPRMSFGADSVDPKSGSDSDKTKDLDFTNYFNLLSTDDVSEPASYTFDTAHSMSKNKIHYSIEPQVSREDAVFALHQVFQDISIIRDFLLKTWAHVLGEDASLTHYPLPSAALLTSVGVEIIKDMIQDVSQICKHHGGVNELVDILCQAMADASGLTEEQMWEIDSNGSERMILGKMYKFIDEFLLTPLSLLCKYKDEKVITYNEPGQEIYSLLNQGCPERKNDVLILDWYFTQSHILATKWTVGIAQDCAMNDMRNMAYMPHDMIHLSFVGQLFLDLQRRYPKKVETAYSIMLRGVLSLEEEMTGYIEFLKQLPAMSPAQEKATRGKGNELVKLLGTILLDQNHQHGFLRRNPVLCGLTLFEAQEKVHKFSIEMLNFDTAFVSTIHLYNALKNSTLLDGKWPDMETAMMLFPKEALFVEKEIPCNLEDCCKVLQRQLGIPGKTASNRQRRRNFGSNVRQHPIPRNAEVMCSFTKKYKFKNKEGSTNWSKKHVEIILGKSIWEDIADETYGFTDKNLTVQHAVLTEEVSTKERYVTNLYLGLVSIAS